MRVPAIYDNSKRSPEAEIVPHKDKIKCKAQGYRLATLVDVWLYDHGR